ncbi:MAG: hypothetical protein OEW19_19115, partial [Acidobacteriota bacterium]|nr:hypothetical protein [Acidobacteriota bacterium]
GSFTFGLSSTASGTTAVIHAFDVDDPAPDVMRRGVGGWKLPRHVKTADSLPPGTWVVAEANGSLAIELGAKVGYDFSFVREVAEAGLSGDIGLKLDAAAKATVGFDVSGRYLVVVGREHEAPVLRVRLFKLARRGADFGCNLTVGVTGIASVLPDAVDEFVAAVFGVHESQIVSALANLEKWTSTDASVGALVAGLANDRALALLHASTGIDPESGFNRARESLVHAITLWKTLPDRLSSALLGVLKGLSERDRTTLLASIRVLASDDHQQQKQALVDLLETRGFEQSPIGRLLIAMADRGLLALLDRLPDVRRTAATVAGILDGDVIRRLQGELGRALNLTALDGITADTFGTLDSFLVGRLAAFLDRAVDFAAVDEVRRAVRVVMDKQADMYREARKALTTRYGAEIADVWQRTTSNTALLDVEFDTSSPEGAELLTAVVRDGDINRLLASDSAALRFHAAVMSHELKRSGTLSVSLPTLAFRAEHANTSLASVSVEEDAGRLLLYHVDASDVVTNTRRRYRSSLSIALTDAVAVGGDRDLRVHSSAEATWAYELRHARAGLRRGELEMYTRPFLDAYMRDRFGEPQQWSQWYTELDHTVEGLLANGPDQFGDVLLSLQVSIPGRALGAWLTSSLDQTQASQRLSRAIQRSLKTVIPHYYCQDEEHLIQNAASAALLAWAATPATTSSRAVRNTVVFDDRAKSFYWDWPNRIVRRAQCERGVVAAVLGQQFVAIRQRLIELGRHRQAAFFDASEVPDWIRAA